MKLHRMSLMLVFVFFCTSLAGCSGKWYIKEGNYTIENGLYTYYAIKAYDEAMKVAEKENFQEQQINGVDVTEWMRQRTLEKVKRHIVISEKFDENELSLSEDDIAGIAQIVYDEWYLKGYLEYYGKMGVVEEDYKDMVTNRIKAQKLLAHYDDELSAKVSVDDIISYIDENYASFMYISIAYQNENGDSNQEEYEALCQRIKDGASVESLIQELKESGRADLSTSAAKAAGGHLDIAITKSASSFTTAFISQLFEADIDDIIYFDDTANFSYNIVQKTDVTADDYFVKQEKDNATAFLKSEELEELLRSFVNEYEFTINQKRVGQFDYTVL